MSIFMRVQGGGDDSIMTITFTIILWIFSALAILLDLVVPLKLFGYVLEAALEEPVDYIVFVVGGWSSEAIPWTR